MKLKFFSPDPEDNLKIRRNMAKTAALWAGLIWPHELILLHVWFKLDIDLIKALLLYVTTLAAGTIGNYFWACFKDDVLKQGKDES